MKLKRCEGAVGIKHKECKSPVLSPNHRWCDACDEAYIAWLAEETKKPLSKEAAQAYMEMLLYG